MPCLLLRQHGINKGPTKVELVSTLVQKCAVKAAKLRLKSAILLQAVDLRRRKGEDIEALGTLDAEEMAIFERDEMLLAFASLNPGAIDMSHPPI
ncbi:hypothetical protein ACE6H2_019812 [Prunus campanulata]